MRRARWNRLGLVGVTAVAIAIVAVVRHDDHPSPPSPLSRVAMVAPDDVAADAATMVGGTQDELRAARPALALVGRDARSLRLAFGDCPASAAICRATGSTRMLSISTAQGRLAGDAAARLPFLASLVGRDATERIDEQGEHVLWQVLPLGPRGAQRTRAGVPVGHLEAAARAIASRAVGAGWSVGVRAYGTAAGALVVTVRLDDRALLESRDTSFLTTLYGPTRRPPVWHTLLLVEGPGRVLEAGAGPASSAGFGAEPTARKEAVPAWLREGRTRLAVEITRQRARRPLRLRISCGGSGASSRPAICDRMLRARAVLFAPVQTDSTCLGMASDTAQISGTVAGIAVQRSFDNCYEAQTAAWERLLGVHQPR